MRTTIRLDDQLLADAKRYAAKQGVTLTRVIEDALRERIMRQSLTPKRKKICLQTVKGNGVFPGVDISNNVSTLDRMEN